MPHAIVRLLRRFVLGGLLAVSAVCCATTAQAVTLVELAIDATARPYDPSDPVTTQQEQFSVPPGPGTLIMTYTEDRYVGGPGGFTLDPQDLSSEHIGWGGSAEYTPQNPVPGQPYRVQVIWRSDFSRKLWVATLMARHVYQAFQVRDRGQQLASSQRLTIEFIPGTPSGETVQPAPAAPAPTAAAVPLPLGADWFDSTSILRGDPFNGGAWANAGNTSASATRVLDGTVCIEGLTLESAGTDVTSEGSSIEVALSGPAGRFVVLEIRDAVINRGFSGGAAGTVLPPQAISFAPVETDRIEVSMTGHGWFLLSGLTFDIVDCGQRPIRR